MLFSFVCGFLTDEGLAMQVDKESSISTRGGSSTPSSAKVDGILRRPAKTTVSKKVIKKAKRATKPPLRHTLPRPTLVKSLSKISIENPLSPVSTEKKIFSSPRAKFAVLQRPIPSPFARKTLLKAVSKSYFTKSIFEDKIVYRAPSLFNWNDLVLTEDPEEQRFKWETNLERALRGSPPIAYKGIPDFVPLDELDPDKAKEIRAQQRPYIIQIHHLTQREGKENEVNGESDNPLVWMTAIGHRSGNARLILEMDKSGELKIAHKDLTKEEAEAKCLPHQWIVVNSLHFRGSERSKINRSKFDAWRERHWKSEGKAELRRRAAKKEMDAENTLRVQRLDFRSSTVDDDF
ncbi:MAG: hypothetical protein JSR85_06295 [Proteobacteria bacterium]|nr:hypothetical protein [Pseudomonadota bacterium]